MSSFIGSYSSSPSGSIHRPSLTAGLSGDSGKLLLAWSVIDASLRPVPPFYPALNPRNTAFVGDSPPSLIAARISECLRKRSISAEFDNEANTATCLTIDRVHFTIHLFRGSKGTVVADDTQEMLRTKPDFSHGVIVEVMRTRGDTISFHAHCRSLLGAASGHIDGRDVRDPIRSSPYEYKRSQILDDDQNPKKRPRLSSVPSESSTVDSIQSLEHCMGLLRKDRICAQQLGMESLVALTDDLTSGVEGAMFASLAVLGSPVGGGLDEVSKWITSLVRDRVSPGEEDEPLVHATHISHADTTDDYETVDDTKCQESSASIAAVALIEDAHHGSVLRSLALRSLCNALLLISQHQPQLLRSILGSASDHLVSHGILSALVDDLDGASRPPGVVAGTRLASAHEAALAAVCIRVLAQHSETAMQWLESSKGVLAALEKARSAGKAAHEVLARESEKCYLLLSQDIRTC